MCQTRNPIILPNRDGLDTRLTPFGENNDEYILECELPQISVMFKADGSIIGIDPPGGPLISINYPISNDKHVTKIRHVIGTGLIVTVS